MTEIMQESPAYMATDHLITENGWTQEEIDFRLERAAEIMQPSAREDGSVPVFGDQDYPLLSEMTLGDYLRFQTEIDPDHEFMVYPDRDLRWTYAEFNERSDLLARGMLYIGMRPGDHLGVWARNIPDWVTFMYACAKIGVVMVTMNPVFKSNELDYVLKQSDMKALCIIDQYRDIDYKGIIRDLVPESLTQQRGYLNTEEYPFLKNLIYMGPEKHRGFYSVPELLLLGEYVDAEELDKVTRSFDNNDCCMMQYTSGTTGFPKGVMLTHRNILNDGFFIGEGMKLTPNDRVCLPVPYFHCFGCVLGIMAILTHRCTIVGIEDFDAEMVLRAIDRERATAVYGVPTMYIAELNHPDFEKYDMSSLRTGIMAGSLCPVELMKQVEEKMYMKVTSVYGLTEAAPGMTATRIDDSFDVRCNTVGRDFEHTEVKVIDPETGEECPVGVQGEMCNRGYNTMKGYYKNPQATAEVIDKNGFLHSGDLGVKDEDGNYRITGRIKDMIIRGGENIYPREIEEFLYQLEGVKDVQVAGIPSKKYGEAVGAFIIQHEGADLHESDVRDFCIGKISRYKIPKYIFFVKEFPMTGSGKIQKFKLKDVGLQLCKEQGIEII